ncbi:BTB/POZ domain-containing protein At3g56230-like [Prunus avium]|uniref:BTB/POZ domain-containing protein At3g56230-like n=1 Tax=Prunus avium TaxID=42229 RepID=A0A6P5SI00_PRUAV|nr:BTB/POZ domain-containing protein At3g56230-like [Prunus avium]XP_021813903.1 BTB/POZ domain-containing protein At3g56230-like [Prunus avium]
MPSSYGPSQSVTDGTPLSSPHYDKFQAPSLGAKDFMDMSRWMMAINDKETSEGLLKKRKFETSELEELSEKIEYVNGFAPAYRYQTPTDILLLAGDHGPSVPAHKLLLATRSKILNHIPNSYGSKAPSNQVNTITLHELNQEELESLLDFLYNADLPEEKMNKHAYSLYVAANKYGIPYLEKFCVRHMLKSLSSANAIDVLEIADAHSSQTLKDNVMNYIAKNRRDIIFSAQFEALALKNPNLCVQISRASLKDENKKSVINVKKNINSSATREVCMKQNLAIRRRDK